MLKKWKLTCLWMLVLIALTDAALATFRKHLETSLSNLRNQTKFGRKITMMTVTSTGLTTTSVTESITARPQNLSENPENDIDEKLEEIVKANLTDDGLLWRSMTDGKTWKGYHVPETSINISSQNLPSFNSETPKPSYHPPGTATYIYTPASPSGNAYNDPVYVQGSGNPMMQNPVKYTPDSKNDGLTRSPRYGTPHSGMMGNKNPYQEHTPPPPQYGSMTPSMTPPSYSYPSPTPAPAPSYSSYNSPMPGSQMPYASPMSGGGQMHYGSPTPMAGGQMYGSPMSGGQMYGSPMTGGHMYGAQMSPGYGTMMAAPKEENGMKGMLSKLLAFLPIGLLLAVTLPSLFVVPTRRSLDEDFKPSNITKWVQSYPILDMIGYYGAQTFQNETCFRYIVCETFQMGSREGANVFQKQLWLMANKIDEKVASSVGMKDLWEGITRNGCQQFQCKWMGDTEKKS